MKLKSILSVSFMLAHFMAYTQISINVTSVPNDTPKNANIFAAGSFNNWSPNDPNFQLKVNHKGQYTLTIPESNNKKEEYKFTLGNWENVEGDQNGDAISNRVLSDFNKKSIEVTIESWQKNKEKKSTASKNVQILNEKFKIPQLNTDRRIWIYLPEDYQTSNKKYPVIYMHDGQNLFDDLTAYAGEWKIDETLDSIFKTDKKSYIVVGIDHGSDERLNEYGPWNNPKYGGGKGDLYADFLAKTLKPYIDKNYRTLTSAKNTGLMGSSMGGLISLYAGTKYPTKFGKLGIYSPSTWFTKKDLFQYVNSISKRNQKTKFYFYGGHLEGDSLVEDINEISEILQSKGVPATNIKINTEQKGTHQEKYWAKEFPKTVKWLFP